MSKLSEKLGKYHFNDRVLITRSNHPHAGRAGQLTGEVIPATNQYVIELDDGLKAGAREDEFMLMKDITVGGGKAE